MFNPDDLVRGVLTGVMGGRRKRSKKALKYLTGRRGSVGGMLSNPNTLLTVAGVAWGIFETMQNSNAPMSQPAPPQPVSPQGAAAPQAMPPLPQGGGAEASGATTDAVRMVRLAIAAGAADGALSDADRARIVEQARSAGAEHLVAQELENRRPIAEIVAGVTDPAQRATLYVLAFGIIRADESVSGAERIFLAQLANQLALDPATTAKLESDVATRIDAME